MTDSEMAEVRSGIMRGKSQVIEAMEFFDVEEETLKKAGCYPEKWKVRTGQNGYWRLVK